MGNKQSSSKDGLAAEKQSVNGCTAEDSARQLQATNAELQDQLRTISTQAKEDKEQQKVFEDKFQTCIETMKVQVQTSADELAASRQKVKEQTEELSTVRQEAQRSADELAAARQKVKDKTEELSTVRQEAAKRSEEQRLAADSASKELVAARKDIHEKTEELWQLIHEKTEACNSVAARAAQLEVELAAAHEEAAAAQARSKAATEREAKAVRQRMLAESGKKTAEEELHMIQKKQLEVKENSMTSAQIPPEAEQELAQKTQEILTLKEQFHTLMEQAHDEKMSLELRLDAKAKELTASKEAESAAKRRLDELQATQGEEAADPPFKKAKLEPGADAAPSETESQPGMGMQDEQVQLLLGEMERMQEEKKKRDKVLKEFKQLKKITLEEYVESLSMEAEANKAANKAKGKASAPDVKKVRKERVGA